MNKRFIIFNKKSDFLSNPSKYNEESIVFIKDTKEIWTHDTSFQSIPEGGEEGKILVFKNGSLTWTDEYITKEKGDKFQEDLTYLSGLISQSWTNTAEALDGKVDWLLGKTTIALPNHGKIVGSNKAGDDNANLIMLSQWDVVDLGSTKYPINLNGPANKRPTYNDSETLAYMSDLTDHSENIDEKIQEIISSVIKTDVSSIEDAKSALAALGTDYSTLYKVASTLKSFLEDSDTANSTINKWKEIEAFLSDVTDTETLTGLLEGLHSKITSEIESSITDLDIEQYETKEGAEEKYQPIGDYLNPSDIEDLATKATTLAGYGITDAKIEDGVITLGTQTITPLTEHQSLANYYTKEEVDAMWEWGEY